MPGSGPVAVSPKVNFPALDHQVLALWDAYNVFRRSISRREGRPDYVAYDGPPGTNGPPHIGHMMQSALKDLWPRYKTMQGFRVLRKAGWDTHGLPIELTAEKELGHKSKRDIEAMQGGVEAYVEYCRSTVYRYKDAWASAIHRIGRFLDTDNDYATLTTEYIQTDWWALKQAWDKGLLYQARRIMLYCARCGTSLSQHETAQGYRDISDISLYAKFPVVGQENTFFVAWTTTPWTLLSNVALAVNPDLVYVTVETAKGRLILAEARLEAVEGMLGEHEVVGRKKGSELGGLHYRPLWDFQTGAGEKVHEVVADDYVTAEDGSGLVHLALYGEDDFRIIRKNSLPMVQNVDADGRCTPNTGVYAGRWFREEGLDVDILKDLAGRGLLLGKEKITHSYPHCYRCDQPLMFFAKSGWFLRTSSYKDQMIAANKEINWYPEHIKEGRFGNWLENNVDWNISRERYWGSPLPIWTCGGCGERVCVGSLKELESLLGKPLEEGFDPHKPYIDTIGLICSRCGGAMKREPEVLDSWFNAGIMPWGQWGYPAAPGSRDLFENQFPADFICEAIDQTRGWFYTLLATSTMLTGKSSFKNVICTELISDDQGRKMSKSRGNVVDPIGLCDRYGADAVRWSFYTVNPWTARRFSEGDLGEVLKQVLIPYWNAYSFFVTYARVDGWKPGGERGNRPLKPNPLDRWIISRLEGLKESVTKSLDDYDVTGAAGAVAQFLDDLTNWFVRRSRRRFWKSEDDDDKEWAYRTLYYVLTTLNRLLAPFTPFVSEVVYQNIERGYDATVADSVHLARWPDSHPERRDKALEATMDRVRQVVTLARSLRGDNNVRVRQPLAEIAVAGLGELGGEFEDLILDELNIKQLRRVKEATELFTWRAKGDFKALGPRFGARAKDIAAGVGELRGDQILALLRDGSLAVLGEWLTREDMLLSQAPTSGYWVRSQGDLTVAVSNRLDDGLIGEWLAREFVHHIQNLRREADLEVTDRIVVEYAGSEQLREAVKRHFIYISGETLADLVEPRAVVWDGPELKIGDQSGRVRIRTVK